jgi:hypothetical protein
VKDLRATRSTRPHGRLRAARLFWLALVAGCASSTPLPAPVPETVTRPHVLTDLSSLSTAPTTTLTNLPSGPAPSAATESSPSQASNPQQFFMEQPGRERITGKASAPASERLLNAKAEKFGEFSNTLLHQVLVAATGLEHGEMETKVVPDNVNPVIITAIMNKDGKLKELIVEQHSGSGALDHLMVEACKQGLWAGNPPPEAMTGGEYRIRIEGKLKNFSTSDQKHWEFETHVGLALL